MSVGPGSSWAQGVGGGAWALVAAVSPTMVESTKATGRSPVYSPRGPVPDDASPEMI